MDNETLRIDLQFMTFMNLLHELKVYWFTKDWETLDQ